MEKGAIDIADLAGPFDLQATAESGQSYLWNRADGDTYGELHAHGGDQWYETVVDPIPGLSDERVVLRARQLGGVHDGTLEWEASTDAVPLLRHLFRLDDDLEAILASTPDLPALVPRVRGVRGNAAHPRPRLSLPRLVYLFGPDACRAYPRDATAAAGVLR